MNCRDAREGFPAFSRGGMSLTELALLEAHVRQCVDCRKERESVEAALNSRPQVTPPRVLLPCLSKVTDVIRLGATSFAGRVGARWLVGVLPRMGWLLSTIFKLSARAVANVIDATAFAMMWFSDLLARVRLSLTIAVRDAAQATIETARVGAARLVKRCAHLQISLRSSVATALQEAMHCAPQWVHEKYRGSLLERAITRTEPSLPGLRALLLFANDGCRGWRPVGSAYHRR
jgi:hypothetical protein